MLVVVVVVSVSGVVVEVADAARQECVARLRDVVVVDDNEKAGVAMAAGSENFLLLLLLERTSLAVLMWLTCVAT
ncbi:hypothetical protein DFJ73DRAFT_863524 [Zopfochytrium polystomum]|nr:hypothetical protein DFJ73DRAFT_863524 [Zopfochytrium polystomum]